MNTAKFHKRFRMIVPLSLCVLLCGCHGNIIGDFLASEHTKLLVDGEYKPFNVPRNTMEALMKLVEAGDAGSIVALLVVLTIFFSIRSEGFLRQDEAAVSQAEVEAAGAAVTFTGKKAGADIPRVTGVEDFMTQYPQLLPGHHQRIVGDDGLQRILHHRVSRRHSRSGYLKCLVK